MPDDARTRRGTALAAEIALRPGLTIKTLCDLSGVSGPTYRAAVRGEASTASYEALEAGLAQWDANPRPLDGRVIEVRLSGVLGIEEITIRGHADAVEQLGQSVRSVLDSVRGDNEPAA